MGIKIITDSACDLPEDILQELEIDILPIVVLDEDGQYLDRINIGPFDVYEGMKAGKKYRTSQVPMNLLEEKFRELGEGGDRAIYISFSSGLSGSYQTALMVKENVLEDYPDLELEIVDSRAVSLGQGILVMEAAKMAKSGMNWFEILASLYESIEAMEHIITVDNIEYLFLGGRISRTEAMVGGLLNIRPIIDLDKNGGLRSIGKVRGKNRIEKKFIELISLRTEGLDLGKQTIGIIHANNIKMVESLKNRLEDEFSCSRYIVNNIGPAVAAHTGPEMLAIFFKGNN